MYRVRLLAIAACGIALTGCSAGSDFFKTAPVTVTLRFESEPQGAEVKTSTGQTCRTPCALAVPAADLTASFALNGYQPQTVPVKVVLADPLMGENETRFSPDPVLAELEQLPPPKKKPAPRKPAPRRPAATTAPAPAPAATPAPVAPPPPPPAASSPWPPAPAPGRIQ